MDRWRVPVPLIEQIQSVADTYAQPAEWTELAGLPSVMDHTGIRETPWGVFEGDTDDPCGVRLKLAGLRHRPRSVPESSLACVIAERAVLSTGAVFDELRRVQPRMASFSGFKATCGSELGWILDVTPVSVDDQRRRRRWRVDVVPPSMASRPSLLVLVRHAESLRNLAKKNNRFFLDDEARRPVRGIPDHVVALTDRGWEQARATGAAIRDRFGAFDRVYHSGYRRAVQTTEAILEAYEADVRDSVAVQDADGAGRKACACTATTRWYRLSGSAGNNTLPPEFEKR